MKIKPGSRVRGQVAVPGDKSISHRAAIISALAPGRSLLNHFSTSQDCASTISCLEKLGVSIVRQGNVVIVDSEGRLRTPASALDCGNSGSTMRMLAGVLAGQDLTATVTGDQSLSARPMMRIIEPLEKMGATIGSDNGKPPLKIKGRSDLKPIKYDMPVASAQVKSSILFAGLNAYGRTSVIERQPTRDHTERLFNWAGVPVVTMDGEIQIHGPIVPQPRNVSIPGDISSAAFFIAAAALLPGSDLKLQNVGLNATRTQFLNVLRSFEMNIEITESFEVCNEPVGDVRVIGRDRFSGSTAEQTNNLPVGLTAQLIDELPLLAVVGTQVKGGIVIRGSTELRFKESDRITATVKNLRALGAEVEELNDGFALSGPQNLRGGYLDSFGDHRIAMAFSVAALLADGESFLNNSECVAVSFPEFFTLLESIVEN